MKMHLWSAKKGTAWCGKRSVQGKNIMSSELNHLHYAGKGGKDGCKDCHAAYLRWSDRESRRRLGRAMNIVTKGLRRTREGRRFLAGVL